MRCILGMCAVALAVKKEGCIIKTINSGRIARRCYWEETKIQNGGTSSDLDCSLALDSYFTWITLVQKRKCSTTGVLTLRE